MRRLLWRDARLHLRVPRGARRAGRARVRAALDTHAAAARGRGAAQHARARRAPLVARARLVPRRARAAAVHHGDDGAHRLQVRTRAHLHRRHRHDAHLLWHDGHRARPRAPLHRGQLADQGAAMRARRAAVLEGLVHAHGGEQLGGARRREARARTRRGRRAAGRAGGGGAAPRADARDHAAAALGARGRLPRHDARESVRAGAAHARHRTQRPLHARARVRVHRRPAQPATAGGGAQQRDRRRRAAQPDLRDVTLRGQA